MRYEMSVFSKKKYTDHARSIRQNTSGYVKKQHSNKNYRDLKTDNEQYEHIVHTKTVSVEILGPLTTGWPKKVSPVSYTHLTLPTIYSV